MHESFFSAKKLNDLLAYMSYALLVHIHTLRLTYVYPNYALHTYCIRVTCIFLKIKLLCYLYYQLLS